LTTRGDGETRYVPDARVTASLQAVLPQFDLLIGTEEEFLIAGGVPGDLIASLRAVRQVTPAAFVVKRGAAGCCWIGEAVPDRIEDALTAHGERVEVFNVLGAGDAFAAGLLTGLLRGEGFEEAARLANACGALVVSRHACAPAMPTPAELAHWFSHQRASRASSDVQLAHLHRTTPSRPVWQELNVMAFDHRSQFFDLAREAGAAESRLPTLKRLLLNAVEEVEACRGLQGRVGVLIDARYGEAALHAATGRGWWVGRPVELPGSRPLRFDGTHSIGSALQAWPREHVVKCLVHFHPDDPVSLRLEQEARLRELFEATRVSGNELLLEIIPPRASTPPGTADEAVLRSVTRLYNLGIKPEWWKLAPMRREAWEALAALVAARDPQCRGAVILGLNQPLEDLMRGFADAANPLVKGFMVGRTLWAGPSLSWLRGDIDDRRLVAQVADNFAALVDAWRSRRAA
ncbi:MAG TPA: PfkB family carbohydrate kinase, partial [Ideonella sp.]|nr:PfkB family carbohydrate kinase [Ideonella sp.]